MTSHFYNRLVGTIVLVALGVIFLPDILDGKKERVQEEFTEIPLRPAIVKNDAESHQFKTLEVINANTSASYDGPSAPAQEEQWVIEEAPSQKSENPAKSVEAEQAAWTMQLGSFKGKDNVILLVKQLRQQGFTVYTLPRTPVEGQITRVFVGPDISRKKMLELQKKVQILTKLKGHIIPFEPLDS